MGISVFTVSEPVALEQAAQVSKQIADVRNAKPRSCKDI